MAGRSWAGFLFLFGLVFADGSQNESLREEDHHQQHESSGDLHAGKKADERDRSTGGDVAGLAQRKKILQIRQAKEQSYQTEQSEAARSRSFSAPTRVLPNPAVPL